MIYKSAFQRLKGVKYIIAMCSIFSSLGNGMVKPKPSIAPSVFSISPTVVGTTTVIGNANYKVYTFTNTTSNYYTITKTDSIPTTIYYLCVGGGGSGFVGGGGAGQFIPVKI
jgi:hypothetical protein